MEFNTAPPEFGRKLLRAKRIGDGELIEIIKERALAFDMGTRALIFELARRFEQRTKEFVSMVMAETEKRTEESFPHTLNLGEFRKEEE